MKTIHFYEKPGCVNNTRQKQLLMESGVYLKTYDLTKTIWSRDELGAFFKGLPLSQWFNPTAPLITSGELDPDGLNEDEALTAMIQHPLLIRRPLMRLDDECLCGFEPQQIKERFGISIKMNRDEDVEHCPRQSQQCPSESGVENHAS